MYTLKFQRFVLISCIRVTHPVPQSRCFVQGGGSTSAWTPYSAILSWRQVPGSPGSQVKCSMIWINSPHNASQCHQFEKWQHPCIPSHSSMQLCQTDGLQLFCAPLHNSRRRPVLTPLEPSCGGIHHDYGQQIKAIELNFQDISGLSTATAGYPKHMQLQYVRTCNYMRIQSHDPPNLAQVGSLFLDPWCQVSVYRREAPSNPREPIQISTDPM